MARKDKIRQKIKRQRSLVNECECGEYYFCVKKGLLTNRVDRKDVTLLGSCNIHGAIFNGPQRLSTRFEIKLTKFSFERLFYKGQK